MGLKVEGCSGEKYSFEGPYRNTNDLEDRSGVYLIICYVDEKYYPIDVGESKNVKSRVETHDRAQCWKKNCKNEIMYSVYYTPNKQQPGRKEVEQDIRCKYSLPCGDR